MELYGFSVKGTDEAACEAALMSIGCISSDKTFCSSGFSQKAELLLYASVINHMVNIAARFNNLEVKICLN